MLWKKQGAERGLKAPERFGWVGGLLESGLSRKLLEEHARQREQDVLEDLPPGKAWSLVGTCLWPPHCP